MGFLSWWIDHSRVFDMDVLALEGHGITREQPFPNVQKLRCQNVPLVVVEEKTIRLGFCRITTGDDVDQRASF